MAPDATEAMVNILKDFAQYDDNFFPKLAPRIRGRTRNHIAQHCSDVYPDAPIWRNTSKRLSLVGLLGATLPTARRRKSCERHAK